jgi:endonuclease/exonuclease/phosphatase family metal-dependent hydrolase
VELDLLTVNVWALPWPFARDLAERQRRFREHLAQAAYHVVGIQELWWPWHRALRLDSMVSGRGRRDTGLALAGRLGIGKASIHHFRRHAGLDRLKRKGVLSARAHLDGGVPLAVHVTHLQAGPLRAGIRARQVDELLTLIARNDAPAILMGDFNFYAQDAEDLESCARLRAAGFVDTADGDARSTYSRANRYARRRYCDQRFDRVFIRSGPDVVLTAVASEVVDVPDPFSDHDPLHVRVRVAARGTLPGFRASECGSCSP